MVFTNLFKKRKIQKKDPGIRFGRYSDNNKSVEKVRRWDEADTHFKQQNFTESIDAFFEYLADDELNNVKYRREGPGGTFDIYQGSKIVHGHFDKDQLYAEVSIAIMPLPSIPVMRKLLEMNFHLYYSRFALDQDRLCMRFDTDINTANPNKLYYGLKELATKADKQDDLLVQEFASLIAVDTEHIEEIPDQEKEVKFRYMMQWLDNTLNRVQNLDPEKFSGGIAYLLLTVAFRIDYLITPEGKLLNELEKVVNKYFKKEERPTPEKNNEMIEGLQKIKQKTREEVFPYLFRSKYTFSIVSPQSHKSVSEAITNAIQNMHWYRDNNYKDLANAVMEYGLTYSHFSFSLPKPVTDMLELFMQINHADFFSELGYYPKYYDHTNNKFMEEEVSEEISSIINTWVQKYPRLEFNTRKLRFDSLIGFNQTFCSEIAALNLDS